MNHVTDRIVMTAHSGQPSDFRSRLVIGMRDRLGGWELDSVSVSGLTETERVMGVARTPAGIVVAAGSVRNAFLATFDGDFRQTGWHELSDVLDPHSVVAHKDRVWVVSSGTNQVVRYRMGKSGPRDARVVFSSELDNQHFNGLVRHQDRLILSAFGVKTQDARNNWCTGYLLDIECGSRIRNGLDQPHSPCSSGDELMYCESRPSLVRAGDEVFARLRGYVRGLAVGVGGHVYVAESAPRPVRGAPTESWANSALWTLSRSGQVLGRHVVAGAAAEIYDIAVVTPTN